MPTYAIRHRRDTTANWLAANPILLDGELGYERTDDGRLLCKMGDGVQGADGSVTGTHWTDLPYCSGPAGPSPELEWSGTSLRFRNPDGTWGEWTNLQGARGLQGNQGDPGPIGESVPATRASLGGVMIGPGLQVTAEGCISILPDGVTTKVDEAGLLSALGGNLLLNSEEWLTESGEWEAPVTGWYTVVIIGGGQGGHAAANTAGWWLAYGGRSGGYRYALLYLTAGDKVPVTIGAGGIGISMATDTSLSYGGATTFGELTSADAPWLPPSESTNETANSYVQVSAWGGGFGAGRGMNLGSMPSGFFHAASSDASFYGGGGGAYSNKNGHCTAGNGMQGAVYVRWHDPKKAAGPLPAPALLSARRMAPRATTAPVTVNLYDPETGQGSVWREEDAEAKLAEGLITEAAWLEICAAKAAEDYAAWLAAPETEAERFEMLRAARDAKLAATDYLVAPDYPLTDEQRAAVTAYRQALRDLPAQEGAPWDGGGELTPWPEEPAITKVQEA